MKTFLSCAKELKCLLPKIVESHCLHSKWLNTLSYLENCGARKIAACEHSTLVKEEMLKHASEEFRHAHYLKRQMERVSSFSLPNYALSHLLGGVASLRYLTLLDLKTCRFLSQEAGLSKSAVKEAAYLLVTYAIELRAEELYPIYEVSLRQAGSRVTVKSILLEEKEHLREMREGLDLLAGGVSYAERVCSLEGELCRGWVGKIAEECVLV